LLVLNQLMMNQLSSIPDRQHEKGITLLELLFVLAVAALIIVFAAARYQQSQWEHKVAVTQRSVQVLLQSLNDYFYRWCSDPAYKVKYTGSPPSDWGREPPPPDPKLIINPFGQAFEVEVVDLKPTALNQPLYQVKLSARYPSTAVAESLRQQLGAEFSTPGIPSDTLIWTRLPALSTADSSSVFWSQNEAFNRSAIEGLRTAQRGNPSIPYIGVCDNRKFQ
jgi:type II secretory pathway pseudopilin PulG